MNATLPVLVECPPYKAKLTKESCASRYKVVNAPGSKEPIVMARAGLCGGCSIGAGRVAELKDEVPTLMLRSVEAMLLTPGTSKKNREASRAASVAARKGFREADAARKNEARKAPASVQTDKSAPATKESDVETKPKLCVNKECGKPFVPDRKTQVACCRKCYLVTRKDKLNVKPRLPSAVKAALDRLDAIKDTGSYALAMEKEARNEAAAVAARKAMTPLQRWFALREVLQERKRVAEEAIARAELDLADHVEAHPEVIAQAREALLELAGSKGKKRAA